MSFTDAIKNSVLEGFTYSDMSTTKIVVTLITSYLIAMYIHAVYKFVTKNAFYYKNYGISMTVMSVVTAGIVMAMQSSLVISLGMVGALSILRFRTAIKDPLDLLFLFWSIAVGIICGAGLYELAIATSVVATLGILLFQFLPIKKCSYLLVINAVSKDAYEPIVQKLNLHVTCYVIKAKNLSKDGLELIVEVRLKDRDETVVEEILSIADVEQVHLLENDTAVKS